MNPFFEYLLKSTISLSLLYLLFKVFMQNDKTLVLNRFLLLGILLFSAVIPLLNVQFFQIEVPVKQMETIREFVATPMTFIPENTVAANSVSEPAKKEINYWLLIYSGAVIILISRLIISVGKVLQLIRNAEKQKLRNIVLAVVKEMIQPFTFLNHVVISEKDLNENKNSIVAHEQAHIKQLHAIDLAVCEVFTLLHFFNPLMWLLRRDLKLIHEYQADQAVLNKGIDAQQYQLLVIQKAVGERRFALANSFAQKPILKRIKMMKKNKKRWTQIKLLLFVPILLLLLQAFARPELISKPQELIPTKYTENKTEQWFQKWTYESIGNGIFQPDLKTSESSKKPNNVLVILMNRKNQFLIEGNRASKENIKSIVKEFLFGINPGGGKGPDFIEKQFPETGKIKIPQGIISFRHDLASSKETMNYAFHAIGEAYLEARNENAQRLFKKDYFDLDDKELKIINEVIPVWFSFEKPKTVKPPPPPPLSIELQKDGSIALGPKSKKHQYSFDEFVRKLPEIEKNYKEFNEKHNVDYPIKCRVEVQEGANEDHVNKLKGVLREYEITDINYSYQKKKSSWNYQNLNDIGKKVTTLKVSGENGEYEKSPPTNWSNVLNIIVNGENKIVINGEFTDFKKLDDIIEDFILGKHPDGRKVSAIKRDIPFFGEIEVPQGIILFRLDINASYVLVQEVTEKIGKIYLQLRDQKSISKFNQPYLSLNTEKRKAIEELIPIRITTGEPKLDKENQQVVFYK